MDMPLQYLSILCLNIILPLVCKFGVGSVVCPVNNLTRLQLLFISGVFFQPTTTKLTGYNEHYGLTLCNFYLTLTQVDELVAREVSTYDAI